MSTASRSALNERFVAQRRQLEDRNQGLNAFLKDDKIARHYAQMDSTNEKISQSKYVHNQVKSIQEKREMQLESRRQQMRLLYDTEFENWKRELEELQDNPQKAKNRMIERVALLKKEKEELRKQFVAEKEDQRFHEGADELRKVESNIKEIQTVYERDIQMMEKQKLLQAKYEEDMIYANLWEREIKRKERKEKEEEIERKKKVEERNHILKKQKDDLDSRKQETEFFQVREKAMLKSQWENEIKRAKEQEEEQLRINKELNKELLKHNFEQKAIREYQTELEKLRDKKMISDVMQKEKLLDQIEHEQREKQRNETRTFLLNFKNRTNEYHTHEAELNQKIKEEMNRQYQKQDERWKKEEEARLKLMHDVYNTRAQDLYKKHNEKIEIKKEKEEEKSIVTQELKKLKEEEEQAVINEYKKGKNYQSDILEQIAIKNARKREEMRKAIEDERARRLAEIEYDKRIREEQDKGRAALMETRKQKPY